MAMNSINYIICGALIGVAACLLLASIIILKIDIRLARNLKKEEKKESEDIRNE